MKKKPAPARRETATRQPKYRRSPPFIAPAASYRVTPAIAVRYGRHLQPLED